MTMKNAQTAIFVSIHSSAVPAPAGDGAVWIQLLPAGSFDGRDGRGGFTTGNEAAMAAIIAASLKLAGTTELVIDYDHQAVFAAVPNVGGTAPAAGWIKELQARKDGIWARVEWTEKAASAIKAGEYRYISPVFLHDKSGNVKVIRMAGLTNTPNLDLAAVAASSLLVPQHTLNDGKPMEALIKLLGLKEGASDADVTAAIKKLQAGHAETAKAAGLEESAQSADIAKAIAALAAKKDEAATPDPAKFVPVAALAELQQTVNAMQATKTKQDAEEAVQQAMTAGKLTPSLKEWAMELATKDLKAFNSFVSGAPTLTSSQMPQGKRPEPDATLTDADQQVMTQLGMDKDAFLKSRKLEIG